MAKMKIGFSASVVDDIVMFRALLSMEVVCRCRLGLKTEIDAHLEDSKYMEDLFIECDESEVDHIRWIWTKVCDTEHEKEAVAMNSYINTDCELLITIGEQLKYTRSLIGDDKHEES